MDYLEMAINESMRLLPTAPRLERVCKKTVELNGVTIPKDTLVGIPTYVLCRDPQLWESPDEFRPERWCDSSDTDALLSISCTATIFLSSALAVVA